jgi:REP element-mobilizing transposase RayT
MPQKVLDSWRTELDTTTDKGKTALRKRIEKYLDQGHGECYLRNEVIAKLVQDALLFHHEEKYKLTSWAIMPNHIHFLARPFKDVELSEIAHSIKSYTAQEANKILGRKGQFWQHEPFDRYIRNRDHFVNVIEYIENNPVKAGLCKRAADWPFSSAGICWRD